MRNEVQFERPGEADFKASDEYQALNLVIGALRNGKVPNRHVQYLLDAIPSEQMPSGYDEKFDLRDELNQQVKLVRGLRKQVFNPNGSIKEEYGVDDANRILNASRDLMKLLQNSHDQLINYARIQAIENAFLDTVSDMPEKAQFRYRDLLAAYLEQHSVE